MQTMRNTGSRRSAVVIYTVVLVGVAAVFAVLMLTNLTSMPTSSAPAAQSSGEMAGMDHGGGEVPASSPSPTMPDEMPGMDHGSADTPGKTPENGTAGDSPAKADEHGTDEMPGMDMPGDSGEHGEHGDATGADVQRPLVPVLGTFGGGTAAVLLTAGLMRSKDRERLQARQAARAARAARSTRRSTK